MIFGYGYNIINTLIYSLLAIFVYFSFYNYFVKFKKINIDFKFIRSVLIFIFIGSILRMFSQSYSSIGGLVKDSLNPLNIGFYFYFPNLVLPLGIFFLICLEFSLFLSKRFNKEYYKFLEIIGLTFLTPLLLYSLLNFTNFRLFFIIIIITIIISFSLIKISYILKSKLLFTKVNKLVLISQLTDGIVTLLASVFFKSRFEEQHVLSKLLFSINPILFVASKVILSLLLIYLIDKYIKEENKNNYFKLFIISLGFLTGIRNLFTIGLLI